jgi:hypothetical protein
MHAWFVLYRYLNKFKFKWHPKLLHSIVVGQNVYIQLPNRYTNSRSVPLRVRYPVDIMGGCTGVVQAEQCKEVTINKIMTVHDQH